LLNVVVEGWQKSSGYCFFEVRQDEDLEFTPAFYSESITPNHVHLDVPVEEQVAATFIFFATT
jgi:hypothetical protein